eukprot:3916949-Prymnesium_polylepis.1
MPFVFSGNVRSGGAVVTDCLGCALLRRRIGGGIGCGSQDAAYACRRAQCDRWRRRCASSIWKS